MALALKNTVRSNDIIARLGGDEFAVMTIETNLEHAKKLASRIQNTFTKVGINAAIGFAMRNPTFGLAQAIKEADAKMYQKKVMVKSSSH